MQDYLVDVYYSRNCSMSVKDLKQIKSLFNNVQEPKLVKKNFHFNNNNVVMKTLRTGNIYIRTKHMFKYLPDLQQIFTPSDYDDLSQISRNLSDDILGCKLIQKEISTIMINDVQIIILSYLDESTKMDQQNMFLFLIQLISVYSLHSNLLDANGTHNAVLRLSSTQIRHSMMKNILKLQRVYEIMILKICCKQLNSKCLVFEEFLQFQKKLFGYPAFYSNHY